MDSGTKPEDNSEKLVKRRGRAEPRAPSRGRGIRRFEALLDSLDALLGEHGLEDIGLYQIAAHAHVPHASVYHFFPTKEAAFLALAQRYLVAFRTNRNQPVPATALGNWQDLLIRDMNVAIASYREAPQAMKLFLGRFGGLETRRAEIAHNTRAAKLIFARLNNAFHLPFVRDAELKFLTFIEVVDSVLGISYVRNGEITADAIEEAHRAGIAYCKLFLPERIEMREEIALRIARGEPVVLDPEEGAAVAT